MKIVHNTNEKYIRFKQLLAGEVFQLNPTGCFFMKIREKLDRDGDGINTVNLGCGTLHTIEEHTAVIPVDCELVIK